MPRVGQTRWLQGRSTMFSGVKPGEFFWLTSYSGKSAWQVVLQRMDNGPLCQILDNRCRYVHIEDYESVRIVFRERKDD